MSQQLLQEQGVIKFAIIHWIQFVQLSKKKCHQENLVMAYAMQYYCKPVRC